MRITLPSEQQQYLQSLVEQGTFPNVEAAVLQAVREFELNQKIEEGYQSSLAGPSEDAFEFLDKLAKE